MIQRAFNELNRVSVTHNNTLGVSLEPDWIIYATKTNEKQEYEFTFTLGV